MPRPAALPGPPPIRRISWTSKGEPDGEAPPRAALLQKGTRARPDLTRRARRASSPARRSFLVVCERRVRHDWRAEALPGKGRDPLMTTEIEPTESAPLRSLAELPGPRGLPLVGK